jgi:UDP-N-acetylmuramoyl-tripeptide--D-alanyl-D-alanine ligase
LEILLVIYFLLFIFALLYAKSTLFWVYLWQLKEYRLDRFLAEYSYAKKIARFWFFSGGRKLWKPKWTIKAMGIYTASLIAALGSIYFATKTFIVENNDAVFFVFCLAAFYILMPAVVGLFVFLANILTYFAKQFIYQLAKAQLARAKNLIVIGITGSYGKSSTKEFLAQILENKFKVRKTPENINTEIGVAKFILQKVNPEDEVLIVEMGAYKKGEIKKLSEIVKPKIGIITGINEQHLSLFGSLKNIIDAKYELIEGLPEDGLAVFNGENKYCLEMAERWGGEKFVYHDANLRMHTNDTNMPRHYLQNLAGVIEVSRYLGMDEDEIIEAVKNIKSTERMIKTFIGKNGALIIDDLYSANPAGVLVALDYLDEQDKKYKIIIMPCLIELGEAAEEIHREIGKKIAEVCDLAVITANDFFDIIKQEAGEKAILAVNSEKAIKILNDKLNQETAVLLEGRLAQDIIMFARQ